MKSTELRQLIRESINEYIREIDEAGNMAALEAKMAKTQEAIELREKKIKMDDLDEAYHDMLDKGKMKELGSEVKALKKSLAKYEKQLDKLKNKGAKVEKVEEKEEEKEIVDEVDIDETFPESGAQLEEDSLNESFLHMQKLAGLITEAEYNSKKKVLVNEVGIIDKAKAAFGGEIKTPKQFDTEKIDGSKLTPEQKDVKNKIIMVLNDLNKGISDRYWVTELTAIKLVDKGLVFDTYSKSVSELEKNLKAKGLKVSSTSESSSTEMDVGEFRPRTIESTRTIMTVTK